MAMSEDQRRAAGIPMGFREVSPDMAARILHSLSGGGAPIGDEPDGNAGVTNRQHQAYAVLASIAAANLLDRPELADDALRDTALAAVQSLKGDDSGLLASVSAIFSRTREHLDPGACAGADLLATITGVVDSIEDIFHAIIEDAEDRAAAKLAAAGPDAPTSGSAS